jgi:hypothetical protein
MTLELKPEARKSYSEKLEESLENALQDYDDTVEWTAKAQYRCRDCGMHFDTLEEHDLHHRRLHGNVEIYPLTGMPM